MSPTHPGPEVESGKCLIPECLPLFNLSLFQRPIYMVGVATGSTRMMGDVRRQGTVGGASKDVPASVLTVRSLVLAFPT